MAKGDLQVTGTISNKINNLGSPPSVLQDSLPRGKVLLTSHKCFSYKFSKISSLLIRKNRMLTNTVALS